MSRSAAPAGYTFVGLLFAIAGVVLFSIRPIWIKLAYAYVIDPVTLLALRMVFSLPFFLGATIWVRHGDRQRPLARRDLIAVTTLGLLSYYAASFLDFLALQYISAGLGRLLLFIYPTIVVVLSALFLGKRVTRRDLAALVLAYLGLALVFARSLTGDQPSLWLGAAFAFASAGCYAVYLVAGSAVIARVGSLRFTAYAMSIASVAGIAQFLLLRPLTALDLPAPVYWLSIAMAVGSTVIPVFMTSEALRRIGANKVAIIGALGPVTTIVFGYFGLDETMTPLQMLGSALVLAGVMIISFRPQAAAQSEAA